MNSIRSLNKLMLIHRWTKLKGMRLRGRFLIEKEVKALGYSVGKHLSQVEQLDMELIYCRQMTDKGIEYIAYMIRNHPTVKNLTLDFIRFSTITSKAAEILGFQIALHLPQLQKLDVTFDFCGNITEKGLKVFIMMITRYLVQLQHLNLNFDGCDAMVTDKTLQILGTGNARHLIKLQSLKLRFQECEGVTDKGVQTLASQIGRHLIGLKSLNLCFDGCFLLLGEGLQYLSLSITHLLLLRQLTLSFQSSRISEMSFMSLGMEIGSKLQNLTSLDLNFTLCHEITDLGLDFFASELIQLTSLQEMKLNFDGCNQITEEGIKSLGSCIADNSTRLKLVKLNFT